MPVTQIRDSKNTVQVNSPSFLNYVIKEGDTLYALAKRFNISVEKLCSDNNIADAKMIKIGTNIKIRSASSTPNNAGLTSVKKPLFSFTTDVKESKKPDLSITSVDIGKKIRVLEKSKTFLRKAEGMISNVRKEPSGDLSAGYGHKVLKEDNMKQGDAISKEKAEQLLAKDVDTAYKTLYKELGPDTMKKLSEEQLSALTSYVFNIGSLKAKSPSCMEHLKKGEYDKAQAEIDIVKVNDKISAGMIKRRMNEMIIFGKGKLSNEAKTKLLKQVNSLYGTDHKSLKEAGLAKKKELITLEAKKEKTPSTELTKLSSQRELINLLISA